MSRRVLIIGIDGGTWTILKPAMEQGYMPFLKELCENGSSGVLESTMPAITPAAWAAFQTGMNPGKTGAFEFFYWDVKQRRKNPVSSNTLKGTIWEIASDHGKTVGALNVPMTYPPKAINGYIVTGVLTPSIKSRFTYPISLKEEILCNIPAYRILNAQWRGELANKRLKPFVQQAVEDIKNRTKLAQLILEKEVIDLFMVHYQASDVLQHKLWAYIDETSSYFDSKKRDYIYAHFYRQLDQNISQIKKMYESKAGKDHATIIVSDHGFQTHCKRFNLGKWLNAQGYLCFKKSFFWFPFVKDIVGKVDVLNLRRKLSVKLRAKKKKIISDEGPFDWDRSRVLSIGVSGEAFIYLLEQSPEEKEATTIKITAELEKIVDPQTGRFIIKRIYSKEEVFKGDFLKFMPDLIIEPIDTYTLVGTYKSTSKLFQEVTPQGEYQVGTHHEDGIIVWSGPEVLRQQDIRAHITDIAPTVLYYLGLPIHKDVDGSIIKNIFSEKFLGGNIIPEYSYTSEKKGESFQNDMHSEAERQEIEERLRDLGYL